MKEKQGYGKIKVPNNLLSDVDAVVGTLGYRTRAEFINESIRTALKEVAKLAWHLEHIKDPKTCPECLGAMKDGKCQSCGWTQKQADRIRKIDAITTGYKAVAQLKLEDAKKRVKTAQTNLDKSTKRNIDALIHADKLLLEKAQADVKYWQDVVDGKR